MRKQTIRRGREEVIKYMSFHPHGIFTEYDIGKVCGLKRMGSHTLGARYFLKKLQRRGVVEKARFRERRWALGWRFTRIYLAEQGRKVKAA